MEWHSWIILGIVVVSMVLRALFRAKEDERDRRVPRPLPHDRGPEREPARSARTADMPPPRKAAVQPASKRQLSPRPKVDPGSSSRPASATPSSAKLADPGGFRPATVEVVENVLEAIAVQAVAIESSPSLLQQKLSARSVSPPSAARGTPSAALSRVADLLGSRNGMRLAVALREVLAPPLCRRRRHAQMQRGR